MNRATERTRSLEEEARRNLNRGFGNASAAVESAADSAQELVERTRRAATDAVDTGAEYARAATRRAGSFAADLEDSIHRNPLMAVGIAAFAGFIYGYFRRR
jgi:ElaB/YqjD/DUF883 family membrane-anchored ribosome-binding protein